MFLPFGQKNFLTENALAALKLTQNERKTHDFDLLEEDRLFNNLLSSQPLCFNFFGELKMDLDLATEVVGRAGNFFQDSIQQDMQICTFLI